MRYLQFEMFAFHPVPSRPHHEAGEIIMGEAAGELADFATPISGAKAADASIPA